MITNDTQPVDRQNAIGALRLLLASFVIFSHAHLLGGFAPEWLADWSRGTIGAGTIGVQCFFALSGWLVTTSWRRQPSLTHFLWHRFLRLAPALWVCLAVTALLYTPVVWLTSAKPTLTFPDLLSSAAGYFWHNLVLPRSQVAVGPIPSYIPWAGDWNGSLWSLFYEGACYLMIAGLGLAGLLTRGRVLGTALIGLLVGMHVVWAVAHPSWLPGIAGRLYDTPGKLLTLHFLAGAVWGAWPELTTSALRRPYFALVAALLLAASWHGGYHPWMSPLVLPLALLWLGRHGPLVDFERTVGGDYSYGLYIYGYPSQQLLAHFGVHRLGFYPYLLAGLALALVLAVASWHFIEKPAMSLRSIFWPPRADPVPSPA